MSTRDAPVQPADKDLSMAEGSVPSSVTFRSTVELGGKTATGIEVPPDAVAALDHGKRPPVRVTVGGHTYPSTVAVMGGRYLVPLAAEHRIAAGVAAGDEVEVTLTLDDAPRTVEVPEDFAVALDSAGVRQAFDALAFSHRKEHVRAIEEAKKPETRAKRIAKAIEMLS
jgi:hypothetical protein